MKKKQQNTQCRGCGHLWDRTDLLTELEALSASELRKAGWKLSRNREVILRCPQCENADSGER
jgi:hypothetical protein